MEDQMLRRAADMAREGRIQDARYLIRDILAANPDHLQSWGLMFRLARSPEEALICLNHILRIKPGDHWATTQRDRLKSEATPRETAGASPGAKEEVAPTPEAELDFDSLYADLHLDEGAAALVEADDDIDLEALFGDVQVAPEAAQLADELDLLFGGEAPSAAAPPPASTSEAANQPDLVAETTPPPVQSPEPALDLDALLSELPPSPTAEKSVAASATDDLLSGAPPSIPPVEAPAESPTPTPATHETVTLETLVDGGSISLNAAVLLEAAVASGLNILVTGEESARTPFFNALAAVIPADQQAARQVFRQLSESDLPALDHAGDGLIAGMQAGSPREALNALVSLIERAAPGQDADAVRGRVASVFQFVAHAEREADGKPHLAHLDEVQGAEGGFIAIAIIFAASPGGEDMPTGVRPESLARIEAAGIELPPTIFTPQ